jgi:hypothetical protein
MCHVAVSLIQLRKRKLHNPICLTMTDSVRLGCIGPLVLRRDMQLRHPSRGAGVVSNFNALAANAYSMF